MALKNRLHYEISVKVRRTGSNVKGSKLSFTTRYVLTFGILLFVANAVLGLVILNQSKSAMRSLVNKDMLDVVRSAAGSLDGDVLGSITAEDEDGPEWLEIEKQLLVYQHSVDIHFIYAVKEVDEDHYVFTIDPDPVDPGAYGEDVVTTPALVAAGDGTPTVDSATAADRWGNFYSAYCPVFDSHGNIAGIVGVDFDAEWYDNQIRQYTWSIAIVTTTSVLLGGVVIALITTRVRKKFTELNDGLEELSSNVDLLMGEMASYSGMETSVLPERSASSSSDVDEMEVLGGKIRNMQAEMGLYLEYLHSQAYTDALTQVGSSAAYHEVVNNLSDKIKDGTAAFWVIVFDINSLKQLNDTFGHECGDYYIQGAGHALKQGFDVENIFRIGGDEFAVVCEGLSQEQMDEGLSNVAEAIVAFNESTTYPVQLTVSQGKAEFVPGEDASYEEVFGRADKIMYENKREFYRTVGNRRSR